ncbi:hypothetical protein NQ314_020939 [Rhamnusium bicolor]|uniref:UDP-glucuronosyltransferase n=1 Tax=Rhamnusium bicolor TaxID=1586634 RepID=A0AAV8WJE4_9CUCU|nr:hypothetical protein NQ314_020939 [Rhamnusium bicolor]
MAHDIKHLLDEAKQGVVYFSLGTNVKSTLLSKKRMDLLLSALSELPYKVLWKVEIDDMDNIPSNVEIRKWLPQQDILRHPNVKLFITQGGLQSIDEALNSTVPMLIIPFFGDQHFNAHKIAHSGAGLALNFHDFTKEEILEKIHTLILDPT